MKLTRIIFESAAVTDTILGRILNEPNPEKQLMLAKANLRLIGEGGARFVFDLGDNRALKLAPFKPSQNKVEAEHWNCVKEQGHPDLMKFFVPVYEADKNYKWLIVEKIPGNFDDSDEDQMFEYLLDKIVDGIKEEDEGLKTKYKSRLRRSFIDGLKSLFYAMTENVWITDVPESEWFEDLREVVLNCRISVADFREDNFGYRANGDFVILDYGF
jgi:hypothetical protein